MSVFTKNSIFDRLGDEINTLKEENKKLSTRLAKANSQMAKNRLSAKTLLEEREDEINKLKQELASTHATLTGKYEMLADKHDMLMDEHEEFKLFHLHTVESVLHTVKTKQNELEENKAFTDNLMNKSTDIENTLYMKNAELVSRIDVMKEMNEKYTYMMYEMEKKIAENDAELLKRNDTICTLYNRVLAAEESNKEMTIKLNYMNETMVALQNASIYMNNILYGNK
jgi:chromosome segregation ATPase